MYVWKCTLARQLKLDPAFIVIGQLDGEIDSLFLRICSDKLPDTCEGMKINIHDPTSKCFYQGPAVFNPIRHFAVPALPPAQSRRRTFVALGLMVMA